MTAVSRIRLYMEAALPLSVAKKYSRGWDKSLYNDLFAGKYRIYLPLVNSSPSSRYHKTVEQVLNTLGFTITNYQKGIARKLDPSDTRLFKIGSILTRAGQQDLLDKFTRDPARRASTGGNLEVVISRHPYDIAGMSTNRGWTSCTFIPTKPGEEPRELTKQVPVNIKAGTLVAYLIDKQDRNINRPIARVLIQRFESDTQSHKNGVYDSILVPDTRIYGTAPASFLKTVQRWCKEVNKTAPAGIYDVDPQLIIDSDQRTIMKSGPEYDWTQVKGYILHNPSKINEFQKFLSDDQLLQLIRMKYSDVAKYLTKTRLTGEFLKHAFDLQPMVIAKRDLVPDDWMREILEDIPELIVYIKQPTTQDFVDSLTMSWNQDNNMSWSMKNPAWKRLSSEQITNIMNKVLEKIGLKKFIMQPLPRDSRFDAFKAELVGKIDIEFVLKKMENKKNLTQIELGLINKTDVMNYMRENQNIDFLYYMDRYTFSPKVKSLLKNLDFQRLAIDINPIRAVNSLSEFLDPSLQMYAMEKNPQTYKKMYHPTHKAKIYYLTLFPDYIKSLKNTWYDKKMLEAAAKGFDNIGKHTLAEAIQTALKEGRAGIRVTDDDKVVYDA